MSKPNNYLGPRMLETLRAWKELPAGLTRQEAADRLGVTRHALNSVIQNGRRLNLLEPSITAQEAYAEIMHLTEGGVGWQEAKKRVGIIPRSGLSGAVNDLRRSA